MNPLYICLIIVALGGVVSVIGTILKKKRGGNEKYQNIMNDFRQQVDSMLQDGEQVKAICGYKPCAAVTNKRLLISGKEGVDIVQFSEVKKLEGMAFGGSKTTLPGNMLAFKIKAGKTYTLGNHSSGFHQVVDELYRRTGM